MNSLVVIFDLDDTLYPEIDYKISGIKVVEDWISEIFRKNYKGKILEAYQKGISDIWLWVCQDLDHPDELKESLKWIYRLHSPSIELNNEIKKLLNFLENNKIQIGILTDGRSITQKIKIEKLGLEKIPNFISEEYKSKKPDLKRFLKIQEIWPNKKYVYIGDNPQKDFQCSRELNWFTVGVDWFPNRIHSLNKNEGMQPDIWVESPSELILLLKSHLSKESILQ